MSDITESDQASTSTSQISTITDIFARQRASKRPKSPERESFNIEKFKLLVLNFLISNNISFRAATSRSFKELLVYLYK